MSWKRCIPWSLAVALLLGVTMAASIIQIGLDRVPSLGPLDSSGVTAALSIATGIVAFPFALLLSRKGDALIDHASKRNPFPKLRLQFDFKAILVGAIILLVLWSPWIVLQFPGAVSADAMNQIYQFQSSAPTAYSGHFVDAEFVDHHPVFDTLLYGSFIELGKMAGSQNAGLFAYTLLQTVATAFALSALCCYLARLGVPKIFRLVTLAFFALVPLFPLYAMTMVKDSLFSAVFVWWLILYVETFRTHGDALRRWPFACWFAIATLLCCLTKKSGIYITLPGMIVMLFVYRTCWKQLLVDIAVPIAVYAVLFPLVVFPAIGGVEPGGNEEVFGTLYQQAVGVARTYDDLTPEEESAVDAVVDLEAAKKAYDRGMTDYVKDQRRYGTTRQDYIEFLKAYATIGLRHPAHYVFVICELNGTLLAPGKAITYYHTDELSEDNVPSMKLAMSDGRWSYELTKPEPVNTWSKTVHDAYMSAVSSNPLLALLLGRGLYGGWIPIICCLIAMSRDKRYLLAFIPIALSVATLIVGPASSARYAVPFLYATPLMLGILCNAFVVRSPSPAHKRQND